MTQENLAARIQNIEDFNAITRLKHLYCYYADRHDSDNWANLFTEDGVFDGGVFGRHEGRETIRALTHLPFAVHYATNQIIDVDGDCATGKWLLLEPCSFPDENGDKPTWGMAAYEDDYVRKDEEWKIKYTKLIPLTYTPYDLGWEKQRMIER